MQLTVSGGQGRRTSEERLKAESKKLGQSSFLPYALSLYAILELLKTREEEAALDGGVLIAV